MFLLTRPVGSSSLKTSTFVVSFVGLCPRRRRGGSWTRMRRMPTVYLATMCQPRNIAVTASCTGRRSCLSAARSCSIVRRTMSANCSPHHELAVSKTMLAPLALGYGPMCHRKYSHISLLNSTPVRLAKFGYLSSLHGGMMLIDAKTSAAMTNRSDLARRCSTTICCCWGSASCWSTMFSTRVPMADALLCSAVARSCRTRSFTCVMFTRRGEIVAWDVADRSC